MVAAVRALLRDDVFPHAGRESRGKVVSFGVPIERYM
jgi:hypothetical protein